MFTPFCVIEHKNIQDNYIAALISFVNFSFILH